MSAPPEDGESVDERSSEDEQQPGPPAPSEEVLTRPEAHTNNDQSSLARSRSNALAAAISTDYKVLGETDAPDGTGILGHNTATTGTSFGVEGATDSPAQHAAGVVGRATAASGQTYGLYGQTASAGGYGVFTPDNARVGGVGELGALGGSLTGGTVLSTIAGRGLDIDANGDLNTHVYRTNTFTSAGTTWDAVTGLFEETPVEVLVDMTDVTAGAVELAVDGTLEDETGAGSVFRRVVGPTSSVGVTSDTGPVFSDTFSVNGEDAVPTNVEFSSDGTKMFVVDPLRFFNVFAYDLSTAWDLSTASLDTRFSFYGQDISLADIAFRDDGTTLFLLGSELDRVYSYDLSTAWDLSTASFITAFDVSDEASGPTGLAFKDDGSKMFVSGVFSGSIYAYDLTTAWDITTASFNNNSVDISSQDSNPTGLAFRDDGTRMFVTGDEFDNAYAYDLATAWDITTASFNNSIDISSHADFESGIAFRSDGTALFVCGDQNNNVASYSLSTAWDLSTASFSTDFTVDGQDPSTAGVAFKGDGTRMFVSGDGNNRVYSYGLSSAWDLSTASFDTSLDVANEDTVPRGIAFKGDGTRLFVSGASSDTIYTYDLSTAWDLSTANPVHSFDVLAEAATPTDLAFKGDGTKLFVSGVDYANVRSYTLSTAWDLSTASSTANFGVSGQDLEPTGLAFESDGTRMFVLGTNRDNVYSYTLSTAWDLSTASFGFAFDVSDEVNAPMGLALKNDDWRLFIGDNSRSDIHEFATEYSGTAYAVVKRE